VFGHDLEGCVDKCVYVIREVFDELIWYRVWSGCLSGWGTFDCLFVIRLSKVSLGCGVV